MKVKKSGSREEVVGICRFGEGVGLAKWSWGFGKKWEREKGKEGKRSYDKISRMFSSLIVLVK